MVESPRPTWDAYFLELVRSIAARAACDRGRCGALVVRDRRIICTGYVGSPPGLAHCDDAGHLLKRVVDEDGTTRTHCMRTIHAEQNAIAQAARYGLPLDGTTFYCSMEPCRTCAMLIASVGAARVVAQAKYHAAQESRAILRASGVILDVDDDMLTAYPAQGADTPGTPQR